MRVVVLIVTAAVAGCASGFDVEPDWLLRQGIGQLEVLAAAQPIEPLIADHDVPRDVRRRLAVAAAARDFARDRLGLAVKDQYKTAVFLDAPAVVYVVSAAPPT